MKKQTEIETLEKLKPFTATEIAVLKKTINTFSRGGHPMPDKSNISGFGKVWVAGLLKKSERLLAKMPEHKADLVTVKQLIKRFNMKSKI